MSQEEEAFLPLTSKVFPKHFRRETRDSIMYNGPMISEFLEKNRKIQENSRCWSAIIAAVTCFLFISFVLVLSLTITNAVYIPFRVQYYPNYVSLTEYVFESIFGFTFCCTVLITSCVGFCSACSGAFSKLRFCLAICYTCWIVVVGLFGLVTIFAIFFSNRNLIQLSLLYQENSSATIVLYIGGGIFVALFFSCCVIGYLTCSCFQIRAVKAENNTVSTLPAVTTPTIANSNLYVYR